MDERYGLCGHWLWVRGQHHRLPSRAGWSLGVRVGAWEALAADGVSADAGAGRERGFLGHGRAAIRPDRVQRVRPDGSPYVPVAELRLARQRFDEPAQLAFADNLSYNPWHSLEAHRPLGNQNRARRRMYQELSRLRQSMNQAPHIEPTGAERFTGVRGREWRPPGTQPGSASSPAVQPNEGESVKQEPPMGFHDPRPHEAFADARWMAANELVNRWSPHEPREPHRSDAPAMREHDAIRGASH